MIIWKRNIEGHKCDEGKVSKKEKSPHSCTSPPGGAQQQIYKIGLFEIKLFVETDESHEVTCPSAAY